MIWLIKENESIAIVSCNIHKNKETYQLWVERPNGKTKMVAQSEDRGVVEEFKEAIDWAVQDGHKTFSL